MEQVQMKQFHLEYFTRLYSRVVHIVRSDRQPTKSCPHYPKLLALVFDSKLPTFVALFNVVCWMVGQKGWNQQK